MSKMSELAMLLDVQAAELGFVSVEEAEQNGWKVNYEKRKLEPPVVQPELDNMKELEKAHEQWLAEKKSVLSDLYALYKHFKAYDETQYATIIGQAIDFIEKGEQ